MSFGGAALALVLHLLAVFGITPFGLSVLFLIFPVAFLCFGAVVSAAKRRVQADGNPFAAMAHLTGHLPVWARAVFGASFLYAGINFALFFLATGGGTLRTNPDGGTVVSSHGRVVRTLDAEGVRAFHAWEVRLFSGHILPFLLLPGFYFLFAPAEAAAEERRGA